MISLTKPDINFVQEVETLSGQKVGHCYQCGKCTAGCPFAFLMEDAPHKIIHLVQLGLQKPVLSSPAIWFCASCETCTTRCPEQVDVAKLMDTLRELSHRAKTLKGKSDVRLFTEIFLNSVKTKGRAHGVGIMARYNFESGHLFKDANKLMPMVRQGRVSLRQKKISGIQNVRSIFAKAKNLRSF